MAQRPATFTERGGSRNPESMPRRSFDYPAIAAAFAEEGYHAASMDSIAARAGVAKPTLYRYFSSKEELFEAAVSGLCDLLMEYLFDVYDRAEKLPLDQQIRLGLSAYFSFAREHPAAFQLLFKTNLDRSSAVATRIEDTFDRIIDRVTEMFRRELEKRGNPSGVVAEVLATALVGSGEFAARRADRRPEWDEEAVLDLLGELWYLALTQVSRESLEAVDGD